MYTTDVVVAAAEGESESSGTEQTVVELNQNSNRNEKAGEDKLLEKMSLPFWNTA